MSSMADPPDPHHCAQVIIPADPMAVRDGLRALFDTILLRSLPEDGRGTAEIVLAAALNNIVEHAYGPTDGPLRLTLMRGRRRLICRLVDRGRPMPGLSLPQADLPPDDSLAEGGYGWFLIHSLSQRLVYRRIAGINHLFIVLAANSSDA